MVQHAVNAMLGTSLEDQGYDGGLWKRQNLVGIKAPVFSMSKLAGVDSYLGPEMKSTGEAMGIDTEFRPALMKALMAAGMMLPPQGSILLSIADRNKADAVNLIKDLGQVGYEIFATKGTASMVTELGIPVSIVPKAHEDGHPNTVDLITSGAVQGVVNTISGDRSALEDGFEIRRAAAEVRIPCFTWLDTARAAVESLAGGKDTYSVKPLPEYRDR